MRMDLVGTQELLDASNRQNLEIAKSLNLSPEQIRKHAKLLNRPPRVSVIRAAAHSAGEQLSQTEVDVARTRMARCR